MRRNSVKTARVENPEKPGHLVEKRSDSIDRRVSVAPMMDWTDRHCRVFHRQMTRRAMLYTEMVTAAAVIHGPRTCSSPVSFI